MLVKDMMLFFTKVPVNKVTSFRKKGRGNYPTIARSTNY